MINIGIVNIDTSHPKTFAEYLKVNGRARYQALYNDGFRGNDEVEGFISKYNLDGRYTSLGELAEKTDIGFIHGCNWDRHIEYALPFWEKNKPVFIDKPLVGNIQDCRKIEKLAEKNIILGSSSVRYAEEIVSFLSIPAEERGEILNVYGTAGVDEFNYAIHIVEAFGGLLGTGAVSVRFSGSCRKKNIFSETYAIHYNNGINAFFSTCSGTYQPFVIVIMTTKSVYNITINVKQLYGALLERICDFLEKGVNRLAPVGEITESIRIMLAGRISRNQSGKVITLTDIPDNDPGFDGTAFEKEYAKSAKKIYI
ncbi:MAG: hypothetical protein A2096_16680 [Spirochaetes bacterium GWF1_41_5]|nr:MAG: hypothetical protein A2096_16680 [Spirochaetes bacterium GWF1_41_5]HBE03212.1 hypothetical protein [Spirochaetia bacterium]